MRNVRKLASVLRLADLREKQAQAEVANKERELAERRDRADELDASLASEDLGEGETSSMSAFVARRERLRLVAERGRDAAADAEVSAAEVEAAREHWIAAARDRRSADNLSQRHAAFGAIAAGRAAQRTLDELAVLSHARNRRR
ncbi:MAG: flagellar FliJ family protein [Actinomycetota bacterium]|nr:flagellar FliJ family protein [Actinomycetota bacterium]